VSDELLGLGKQPPVLDEARSHPGLHALDEHAILGPDLGVEREGLLDPRLVGIGGDEVVEEAVRLLGGARTIGPIEKFGRPGITLITVPGKRRWNCPRSTSPVGSYAPRGSGRGGPCCVMRPPLVSSRYASTDTSMTAENPGCAVGQW